MEPEIIYSYDDAQAVADGVLHKVSILTPHGLVDRVTAAVFFHFKDKEELADTARRIMQEEDDDGMRVLNQDTQVFWCMKNERNGWTLMFPDDY